MGDGDAIGNSWLAYLFVKLVRAVVDIVVGCVGVFHAFEPSVKALLFAVRFPHGHEGADVFDVGEPAEYGRDFFVDGASDA